MCDVHLQVCELNDLDGDDLTLLALFFLGERGLALNDHDCSADLKVLGTEKSEALHDVSVDFFLFDLPANVDLGVVHWVDCFRVLDGLLISDHIFLVDVVQLLEINHATWSAFGWDLK
jgi:hypothetical protein